MVSACESLQSKEEFKSFPSKVYAAVYGNGLLRECENTEFVWELKRGFVKAVVKESFDCISLKFVYFMLIFKQ